ncbi:hypothetical protein SCP_1700540 [Sparassis crispa]|uniref:Uncharacterized protein n=1 Tax=Sparassis crispa TaxID=139825 RepID=A0A401H5U1_9APHY|nr:hypothetical protein SCP_1700540 [Sparassis crispa]GBE89730.1 hypothetical protein SCP_1700540 [Sparassis crispa]
MTHSREPSPDEFGCMELHSAAVHAEIWSPGAVICFGMTLALDRAETSEEMASWAPAEIPQEVALEEARQVLAEYYEARRLRMQEDPLVGDLRYTVLIVVAILTCEVSCFKFVDVLRLSHAGIMKAHTCAR